MRFTTIAMFVFLAGDASAEQVKIDCDSIPQYEMEMKIRKNMMVMNRGLDLESIRCGTAIDTAHIMSIEEALLIILQNGEICSSRKSFKIDWYGVQEMTCQKGRRGRMTLGFYLKSYKKTRIRPPGPVFLL